MKSGKNSKNHSETLRIREEMAPALIGTDIYVLIADRDHVIDHSPKGSFVLEYMIFFRR